MLQNTAPRLTLNKKRVQLLHPLPHFPPPPQPKILSDAPRVYNPSGSPHLQTLKYLNPTVPIASPYRRCKHADIYRTLLPQPPQHTPQSEPEVRK